MRKDCISCRQSFEITPEDLEFYDRISPVFQEKKYQIPPPALCPECRRQRRFSWRNERNLYHRKCDLSGKQIVSNYSPDANVVVYDLQEWWSDKWDAEKYGREFDFSRSFFEQFAELQAKVPQLSLSVWNSQNSDYCNYVGNVKDSYLIFGSVYSENCYYGSPYYSKNCLDTLVVRECEYSYECIDCRKLYECFFCQDCHSSRNLLFCYDLQGCSDCIACAGLRNKRFCIFNTQYSKEEYARFCAQVDLCNPIVRKELSERLAELKLRIPHRYMQSNQVEHVSGNYIYQSKNVQESYYADRSEDCKFCAQVVDLKDCHDNNFTEENELCYEYLGAYQVKNAAFSKFCNRVFNVLYTDSCFNSHDLFGCIALRNSEYAILNKRYSREEYEALVPRIIEHMQKTGEWGEFFPSRISPFGYNETVADEYFPLSREEALSKSLHWYEEEKGKNYLGPEVAIPDDISAVDDSICERILTCAATGKPYKIIPQEYEFYRKMHLPIPKKCPNERHRERLAQRTPRTLWDRVCAKCQKKIRTSYAPERPETVYCEECYLSSVY